MSFASGNKPIEVVDIETAQTLLNKTLTAPVINGGEINSASISTPEKLDPRHDIKANLIVYAQTASDGQLVYSTDTKEIYIIKNGGLSEVGGINFIPQEEHYDVTSTDITNEYIDLNYLAVQSSIYFWAIDGLPFTLNYDYTTTEVNGITRVILLNNILNDITTNDTLVFKYLA